MQPPLEKMLTTEHYILETIFLLKIIIEIKSKKFKQIYLGSIYHV